MKNNILRTLFFYLFEDVKKRFFLFIPNPFKWRVWNYWSFEMFILIEKGGALIFPLLLLSFVAVTFIIERGIFFVTESKNRKPRDTQKILSYVEKNRFSEAEDLARRLHKDFIARTLLNGLVHRKYSLSRALETQALNELRRMKKNLTVLDTVISIAPLLGILGTVIGIISSFNLLGGAGIGNPTAVTGGISEALITTAAGLMIAIITIIPYNIFQSRYQRAVEELESVCSVFEIIMKETITQNIYET